MYKDHDFIKCKYPDNTKIWRYMDLWKFLSIIIKEALYFTRIDLLGDPFEGTISEKTCNDFISSYKSLDKEKINSFSQFAHSAIKDTNHFRRLVCANCWHASQIESIAFWSIYANRGEGLAIQSTIGKIKDSFKENPQVVFIGDVKYIDYSKDPTGISRFDQFFKKNLEYQYENEVRLLTLNKYSKKDPNIVVDFYDKEFDPPEGQFLKIDVKQMIEEIIVPPNFDNWKIDVLEELFKNYHLNFILTKSKLADTPYSISNF